MTAQYFTVLTNYGTQAFAKAIATNQPIQFSSFAVGDGNGQAVTPTADRTALVKETHRANVSAVSLDPRNNKQIIIELTIPEDVGGFYIREMGVFDSANKLVAYANAPESFKPTLESGSGKVQVLRMILKVSNSQAVTLSIDNSVIFVTRQQFNPKKITSSTTNGFDESGHTHEIEKADTTKAGIVQLTDDTGLDSDKLGLSARAGKKLAQLISTVQLALGNYIPNNKKSNSVTSTSNDNVATSSAVKTAYDKGVEAKTAADEANSNANGRVPYKLGSNNYAQVIANRDGYGGYEIAGGKNNSSYRIESEDNHIKFWSSVNGTNYALHLPALTNGWLALQSDVDKKVSKAGDEIEWLNIKRQHAWLNITSTNDDGASVDFAVKGSKYAQASVEARSSSGYSSELRFHLTPSGNNYDSDRRQHIMTVGANGNIWAKSYGWLHDYFMKRSDFIQTWYPNHYNGTTVYKIRHLNLMITVMYATGDKELILPEIYDGHFGVWATDRGTGKISVNSNYTVGNNRVRVGGRGDTAVAVLVIGYKNV
jgi:probable tail fiber protein|nr:MAG TPA: tail collar fiber protein [Caudoviricetes sp.]